MKEFIEKLISRLEEQQAEAENEMHRLRSGDYVLPCSYDITDIKEIASESFKESIEIVNELAEEYINTSSDTSSGWIACSEKSPDIEGNTSDTVLVCTIDGFQHMAFWCDDEKWRYCESGMIKKPMEWTEIIAWMPLPAPYKKGE